MAWFGKKKSTVEAEDKRSIAAGIFRKCDSCGATLDAEELTRNLEVCPECGHHDRLSAVGWLDVLLDPGSFVEHDIALRAEDPLGFNDSRTYTDRLAGTIKKTGVNDALLAGTGTIQGREVELCVFLFQFMGGSMGSVVGEKITRALERGAANGRPVVLLSASGGARMQEGALSLMQMAKTVAALGLLRDKGMPFISVLLNPTTGGVAASFSFLGDVNIAEPKALIGFAGARVIESTIRQRLPEGFQRAEFLLEHGMIDIIAQRHEMRATIARVLSHMLD